MDGSSRKLRVKGYFCCFFAKFDSPGVLVAQTSFLTLPAAVLGKVKIKADYGIFSCSYDEGEAWLIYACLMLANSMRVDRQRQELEWVGEKISTHDAGSDPGCHTDA